MKKAYKLEGLCCANCAAKIERAVRRLAGVTSASVNFMTTRLVIEGDEARFEEIASAAERIVKKYEPRVVVKRA